MQSISQNNVSLSTWCSVTWKHSCIRFCPVDDLSGMNDVLGMNEDGEINTWLLPFFFFFRNGEILKGFWRGLSFSLAAVVFFPEVRFLVCVVICTCSKNIHCTCLLLQVDHHWNETCWEKRSSERWIFKEVSDDSKMLWQCLHVHD